MSLLAPLQLLWLTLLVPLVVLYILRRRRVEKTVGSTLLWEQAMADLRAERPWRKLIPQTSLLLQALAIIVGSIALARPVSGTAMKVGAHLVVVIDASPSMAALEADGRSRLELAKQRVRSLAARLEEGSSMMLIEADREPVVIAPMTSDRAVLDRAVAELKPQGGSGGLERSLTLAAERIRGAPTGSRIVLLTDGATDEELAVDGELPLDVVQVGTEQPSNVGIVDANARARAAAGPDHADLFVRLAQDGERPVDAFVTARIRGREGLLSSRRITLEPESSQTVVFSVNLPPSDDGQPAVVVLEAESVRGQDALRLDDRVVLASPGARRIPVVLVGPVPLSVQRVFRADPDVELFATTLDALESDEVAALEGLWVYGGQAPEEPPAGLSLVVDPVAQAFEVEVGEPVERSAIVTWDDDHPLLRFVAYHDVQLGDMKALGAQGAQPLLITSEGPAIVSRTRPSGESVVIGFDPDRSNWPDQPSFVVFFRNLLELARQRRAAGGIPSGELGEPLRVPVPSEDVVRVTTPSAQVIEVESQAGLALVPIPAEPGVYEAQIGERRLHALRNLLDAGESNLRPRLTVHDGDEGGSASANVAADPQEAWIWLALVLLVVLGAEVFWATRRRAT